MISDTINKRNLMGWYEGEIEDVKIICDMWEHSDHLLPGKLSQRGYTVRNLKHVGRNELGCVKKKDNYLKVQITYEKHGYADYVILN